MKTNSKTSKPAGAKEKTEIKTEGPLSEKDEIKKAEEKMRESQQKLKK